MFVMRTDISRSCNVKRLKDKAGDPPTEFALLQHKQSHNYIAFQGNQVLCIPLQRNDPRCTFTFVLRIENDDF